MPEGEPPREATGELRPAIAAVRARTSIAPVVWVVAGSGLAALGRRMADPVTIPFGAIPGWPVPTVPGHPGSLVLGRLGGRPAAVAVGRSHLYEGCSARDVTFGVRLAAALGARTLVVTCASGGLNAAYEPGDLVVLEDQLFLPGMAGMSPLVGPDDDRLGARFPLMVGAYDPDLRRIACAAGAAAGLRTHEGVYAMVVGPAFETPAEARFLRALGADVVGMSTAPEVMAARRAGMRVLGLSVVTNRVAMENPGAEGAAPTASRDPDPLARAGVPAERPSARRSDPHAEVTAVGAAAAGRVVDVIETVVRSMDAVG